MYNVGELAAVGDLSRTSSTITWDAPFSLNLTNVDPDIVYCVEVRVQHHLWEEGSLYQ